MYERQGASHKPHSYPVPIDEMLTGSDVLTNLIYFQGGTNPIDASAHNLFAADREGYGRDRIDGLNAFRNATNIAVQATDLFFQHLECKDVNGHLSRLLKK
ncbi:MAG: hypothetical protein U0930_14310 [Pirellulales bacterium]